MTVQRYFSSPRESRKNPRGFSTVIPAKAGIQSGLLSVWIPAFAGMTDGSAGMTDGSAMRFTHSRNETGDDHLGTKSPAIVHGGSVLELIGRAKNKK
jgi:hypothetical protein